MRDERGNVTMIIGLQTEVSTVVLFLFIRLLSNLNLLQLCIAIVLFIDNESSLHR